jgi:hypothetical protein
MSGYLELAKKARIEHDGGSLIGRLQPVLESRYQEDRGSTRTEPSAKLGARRQRNLEEASRRGLVVRRASERGWIELHDPLTGEWHEVRASQCLPGVVESANRRQRKKRRYWLMGDVVKLPEPGVFGECPKCGKNDGYLNVEREHWFVCEEHRVKWFAGANLFSSWRHEPEQDWEHNYALLAGYREVESWIRPQRPVSEVIESDDCCDTPF